MTNQSFKTFGKIKELLQWLGRASTVNKLDSPFLFEFYQEVIQKTVDDPKCVEIEEIRKVFLMDERMVEMVDYGAGSFSESSFSKSNKRRSIRSIAKSAVSSKRKCSLLYKIIAYYTPKNVLELGMSLGISTLYLKAANTSSQITTIEGDFSLVEKFKNILPSWANDVSVVNKNFEEALKYFDPSLRFDLIYIDGGHHSRFLLPLMEQLKNLSMDQTVFIIDDIYWSKDMKNTWQELKSMPEFNIAIDLWYFGLLTFDKRQKESIDVAIPPVDLTWQMGFFR